MRESRPQEPSSGLPKALRSFPLAASKGVPLILPRIVACAIDIEGEHRHRRLERRAYPPVTALRGPPERRRDRSGIVVTENAFVQIESVAVFGDFGSPGRA